MEINNFVPKTPLDRYVEAIIYFKNFVPDHSIERVVPTGHSFLIFELDGMKRFVYDNQTLKPIKEYQKIWFSGIHQNFISISAHKNSEMFVVQFKPTGVYPFVGIPLTKLQGKVIGAEEIFGNEVFDVRDQLIKKEEPKGKLYVIEQWLMKKINGISLVPDEIIDLISRLYNKSEYPVNNVKWEYSKSQKQLIHDFKKYIGITPKYFHRIIRFNEILEKIHRNEKIKWAEVSYDCGYADQSHFIKDFKHFSGFNPEEYLKNEFQGPNFFPIDSKG